MRIEDDIRLLKQQALFQTFESEALKLLASAADRFTLRAGEPLYTHGQASDGGFFLREGLIALAEDIDGGEIVFVSAGALIGELALFTETARIGYAIAREPCQLLRLPRSLMARVLTTYPTTTQAVRQHLMARFDVTRQEFERFASAA